MFQRWISCLLLILLVACSSTATPEAQVTPVTQNNSATSPQTSVKKVVALSSIAADIIYQLDQTKLVGMTGSSLFQKDARFKDIPRVSENQTPPNLEKIIALKPDLAIIPEGFFTKEAQRLQELGITVYTYKLDSWQALEKLTQDLAKYIDADPQPLINRYQSFIGTTSKQNVSALVLVSPQPLLSPNKNSWAGDLLTKFQVQNITGDLQGKSPFRGYITLSPEKVLEVNPEVLLVVNPPQQQSEAAVLDDWKKQSFWQKLNATKNNRVYVLDYYGFINAGSIDAIEKSCKKLQQALSGG
ncbi:ABC transporter substrate-binding protein [Nostoc sp. UHCC 0870]|uniref:ABC transporter substrate-binding protein n=1 Tax=Nostoc sp. UHCC 0870 TaxID=2914041 RepID=UPI001EE0ADCC|nr:ABC transporter substrate-binding protein [Nostoc sp. UHCC 0870]UKO99029.1 ABC transporter substrate-binding protein [Nostoc sp. UHCC 0870]